MRDMIRYVKNNMDGYLVGCEVGVWEGKNALNILENLYIRKLYLVDPWKKYRISSNRFFSQDRMDMVMGTAIARLLHFEDMYYIVRKSSVEGARHIESHLDFVYLDAQHDYKSVKRDINIWYHKLRSGGVLGGHDYDPDITNGVVRAVNNFVSKYRLKLFVKDLDWWVVKI